ncbi:MAG: hypothetical protein KF851_00400 [Pirellulaceae bacterium]|nr:hypothetical protein [Pirellulaceae bacterium]
MSSSSITRDENNPSPPRRTWFGNWKTVLATWFVFIWYGWQGTPGVNESHYLTKARHFWDPSWCAGDLFLESHSAHWGFYFFCCWPLLFLSLDAMAWLGRIAVWGLAALGWENFLSRVGFATWLIPVLAMLWLLLIEFGHLAGEWVIGGYEAKSLSYALILNGFAASSGGKQHAAWRLFGLAAFFHVLVGGWVLLAFAVVRVWTHWNVPSAKFQNLASGHLKGKFPQWMVTLAIVLGLVAASVFSTLMAEIQTAPEIRILAAEIQVKQRLSHHLLFGGFETKRVAAFALLLGLMGVTLGVVRNVQQLMTWRNFAISSLAFSLIGLLLSAVAEGAAPGTDWTLGLLRLYWFRLADFAVPVFVALSLGLIAARRIEKGQLGARIVVGSLVLIVVAFGLRGFERLNDSRSAADRQSLPSYPEEPARTEATFQNWRKVCKWIRENTPEHAVFLTPADQQTFKWYAERAEVVCWKDMPQDSLSLVEWWRRVCQLTLVERASPQGLAAFSDQQLLEMGREYGAGYLVLPQRQWDQIAAASRLSLVYPANPRQRTTFVVVMLAEK